MCSWRLYRFASDTNVFTYNDEKIHNLLFRIWKVLYACKENVNLMEMFADQVDIVRQACGEQESCSIEANSQVFGKKGECAGNF